MKCGKAGKSGMNPRVLEMMQCFAIPDHTPFVFDLHMITYVFGHDALSLTIWVCLKIVYP